MKITYIKLENVAGLMVGSNKDCIEISFDNSQNKIVSIQGSNGRGKSVLLSSLTPFSGVTTVDERNTLSYIIPGKNGYKEIHYQDGDNKYIIKHYYKASKDTHSVKSYFMMNDEELNENGNVSTFNSLVEIHLGLTQEMMRLIRLGTNVNSFITLTPARRKEYIGKLIEEIDLYLKIYKKINDDIRVVRTLLNTNHQNLYNCHISDITVENDKLKQLKKELKSLELERDKVISKLGELNALLQDNDIDSLTSQKHENEIKLHNYNMLEEQAKKNGLEHLTMNDLINKRDECNHNRVETQSKINAYRINIDTLMKQIEKAEVAIARITSNNDLNSLMNEIQILKDRIDNIPKYIREFRPNGVSSNDVNNIMMKLSSFNKISQMIYTLGNKPVEIYVKLKTSKLSIDKWLKEQVKRAANNVDENEIKKLFSQLFADEDIITPNCDINQFTGCPYYRLADTILSVKDKLSEDVYDSETLHSIQVISNNIDNILNECDIIKRYTLPDNLLSILNEESIINRLSSKIQLFDLSEYESYLSVLRDYELYLVDVDRLKQYEQQLSVYKQSGIESQMSQIKEWKDSIEFYRNNTHVLSDEIDKLNKELSYTEANIILLQSVNDSKHHRKLIEFYIQNINEKLKPLETAKQDKSELDLQLRDLNNRINLVKQQFHDLEMKINEFNRLTKENEDLTKQFDDLNIILESVSTKKGIPVIYMQQYLGKIQKLANNLLEIIYDGDLKLAKFKVTQDTFEVPYKKNGSKIPDVKYASQSEVALITMALSFALANRATGKYNILLLDEIDAGLDDTNRSAFLKMLNIQINALKAEQVFIISHNFSQMINIPMDCIKLSETSSNNKMQNIIYSI